MILAPAPSAGNPERQATVGVVTTLAKGYDTSYPWKTMGKAEGGMSSAGYYMAEGEPPGRWFGRGAEALGLVPGSRVERKTYDLVVDQRLDPRDGVSKLGRSPAKAIARADAIYQRLLEAEPGATESRRWELRAQAQREARQGPLYMDLTVSLSKSISVFYASLGENWRRAKEAGDQEGMALWAGLIGEVDEMIHAANQAGLEYFEREAGWTRTGYHGGRAGEQQTGQFREAGLVVASFLQHTSRADDIQLHVHNVIPQAAQTDTGGTLPGGRACLSRPTPARWRVYTTSSGRPSAQINTKRPGARPSARLSRWLRTPRY